MTTLVTMTKLSHVHALRQSHVQMTPVHAVTSEPSPHADGYETARNQLSTGDDISITQSRTPGTPIGVAALIQGSRLAPEPRGPLPELLISFVSSDLAARFRAPRVWAASDSTSLSLRLRVFLFRRFLTFVIIPGNSREGTTPWRWEGPLPPPNRKHVVACAAQPGRGNWAGLVRSYHCISWHQGCIMLWSLISFLLLYGALAGCVSLMLLYLMDFGFEGDVGLGFDPEEWDSLE